MGNLQTPTEHKDCWKPDPVEWGELVAKVRELYALHNNSGCTNLRILRAWVNGIYTIGVGVVSWLTWLTVRFFNK